MKVETLFSSATDEWETPKDFFDELNDEFHFDLDVCATEQNAKCERFFSREQDGLMQEWTGTVWCNPPYGRNISRWMQKAYESNTTVVCLVHARTDTKWFHEWVLGKAEIRFVKGRIRFGGSKNNAPFPSMIVIYRPRKEEASKRILDVTCGSKTIWFKKDCPDAIFCDKRRETYKALWKSTKNDSERDCTIDPDVVCDFSDLPFDDNSFYLVVFDPPHLRQVGETSWMAKKYGKLGENWQQMIHDGFWECMRVLKPNGTLIFKWSEIQIPTREVIRAIGMEPLFGRRSGKRSLTHWMTFMKGDTDDYGKQN